MHPSISSFYTPLIFQTHVEVSTATLNSLAKRQPSQRVPRSLRLGNVLFQSDVAWSSQVTFTVGGRQLVPLPPCPALTASPPAPLLTFAGCACTSSANSARQDTYHAI
ncbi:hypothetical protein EVAR_35646_1 [Eumeta japonica]|uniref:Uncharacterized protein n=1 Tax=Eumeta variegata TaxID=151549 RepID=A0A4C1WFU8_EUMVA|nr:hypothetical protein EVAR_35646_1 [Eumeta japonica]